MVRWQIRRCNKIVTQLRTHDKRHITNAISVFSMTLLIGSLSAPANATKYLFNDYETQACNTIIADRVVEGAMIDTDPASAATNVKCDTVAASGSKYLEWRVPSNAGWVGVSMEMSTPAIVSLGTTYYLAGFFRFKRINSADIWHDTGSEVYSFDKLLEFRGDGFRWGIGAGWNGWYSTGADHKFTFDAWYATSVLGDRGPDHIVANVAPFSATNPLLSDYDLWHGVVLGVTASNSINGRVQLWVNGVKVIDKNQYTANAGASISQSIFTGTVAQPAYDAPEHYRNLDAVIITDNWQDIVDGGYLGQQQTANTVLPARDLQLIR